MHRTAFSLCYDLIRFFAPRNRFGIRLLNESVQILASSVDRLVYINHWWSAGRRQNQGYIDIK